MTGRARGRRAVTTILTPELTAYWDEPDSFTLAGYRRHGGYTALPGRWPWSRTRSSRR